MRSRIASQNVDHQRNVEAYSQADHLFHAGRFRDALRLFQASAEADPSDYDAFMAIGNCWDALRKPKRAAEAFRQALVLAPESKRPDILFNLGNALFDLGLMREAVETFNLVAPGSSVAASAKRNAALATERLGNAH
jgi:tetratricopeptide (TPR) repeat protein